MIFEKRTLFNRYIYYNHHLLLRVDTFLLVQSHCVSKYERISTDLESCFNSLWAVFASGWTPRLKAHQPFRFLDNLYIFIARFSHVASYVFSSEGLEHRIV
ncbi:unnamed protein product [Amoebophrya sp. A25]|nr:unnamed protein product [Amoebophrya sp. A25]|eukprot:GSA25T00017583001.1